MATCSAAQRDGIVPAMNRSILPAAAHEWRQWTGTVVLAAVGIAIGAVGPISNANVGWWLVLGALFIVAAVFLIPIMPQPKTLQPAPPPQTRSGSAFVRGDVYDSSFDRVRANADFFIDGKSTSSRYTDVDLNQEVVQSKSLPLFKVLWRWVRR